MAKGRDQHQARIQEINSFGREIARRAKSRCELCTTKGESLHIHEVETAGTEADINNCLMICDTCEAQIQDAKHRDPHHWRFLVDAVWSDIPVVQALAIAMLGKFDEDWAKDTLEILFVDEAAQAWGAELGSIIK